MANTIITKNSSTASAVPTSGDLVQGELAVNVTDKRIFTENSGGTVVELGTNPSQLNFADNAKAIFGAGSDLQIYHDGSNSYISDQGTGQLRILASQFQVMNAAGTESMVFGAQDNTATLYYDNGAKLATTSTGIDVTGTVVADGLGIGTSSPSGLIHLAGNTAATTAPSIVLQDTGTTATRLGSLTNDNGDLVLAMTASLTDLRSAITLFDDRKISFTTNATERLRIDSAGNVLVGTTTSRPATSTVASGGFTAINNGAAEPTLQLLNSNAGTDLKYWRIQGNSSGALMFQAVNDAYSAATERMRIDSSGNLLVGTTTILAAENNVEGISLAAGSYGGLLSVSRDGSRAATFNRKTSDGEIVQFRKDGTTVGSIGTAFSRPYFASAQCGISPHNTANYIAATNSTGTTIDNLIDLGASAYRFDDIYATNGTIQTSDANEKQDIEALSDAEARVAVACKGLLRKFRWKDAVAEKGDEARIHFGIIAQDLQAAFAAEGLDAGRYAMFISSTWTDEETGEERTRLGVRYPELLAFIIAAI